MLMIWGQNLTPYINQTEIVTTHDLQCVLPCWISHWLVQDSSVHGKKFRKIPRVVNEILAVCTSQQNSNNFNIEQPDAMAAAANFWPIDMQLTLF